MKKMDPLAQRILPTEKVTVFVDHREQASKVVDYLQEHDVSIKTKQLEVADYICSEHVGVERKNISDFLQSITNQRLFKQLECLANSYDKPLLILEGDSELLFYSRNMHPNAIRGALASIALDYKIPILWTRNARETAAQIFWIANREQMLEKKGLQIRGSKKLKTLPEQQKYLVAGLPFVNTKLSDRLLKEFKTIKKLFNAKEEKLIKIDKIGKIKAKKIWELINTEYTESECDD